MARIERQTKRYPTDLTDAEWAQIEPLLSKAAATDRLCLCGAAMKYLSP